MNDRPQDRVMQAPRNRDRESGAHRHAGLGDFGGAIGLAHESSSGLAVEWPLEDRAGVGCFSHGSDRLLVQGE